MSKFWKWLAREKRIQARAMRQPGTYWKRYKPRKKKTSKWNLMSKAIVGAVILVCVLVAVALWSSGCATKHLSYSSIDAAGKPYTISADIAYLFTDQNTSGFSAEIPGGLKIMFDAQGSQANTEFLTEVLRAYNK